MKAKSSAELAMEYFPDVTKKQARRLFRMMVLKMKERNPHFTQELADAGFELSERYFTPLQMQILFHYVGEP